MLDTVGFINGNQIQLLPISGTANEIKTEVDRQADWYEDRHRQTDEWMDRFHEKD